MFDPHMTDAWKKIPPVSDTKEMTDLFYEMTKEFFDDIQFGNQTYMNVYLKRSDRLMHKKDFIDSLRGFVIEDEPDWEDYTEEHHLETGTLYKIMMRQENARLGNYTQKDIWCFLHKDLKQLGEHHYEALNNYCNGMGRKNYWYSYMENECIFEWHTDGDTGFRYHHVLEIDPTVPAIETDAGPIMCGPGEAFILNTVRPHQVPYTNHKRLHLVGSVDGLQSTGETHNNQWLEDGSFDWSHWQEQNGY
jgi:hypothetical protein